MGKFFTDSSDKSWVDLFTNQSFVANFDNGTLTDIMFDQKFPKEIFFSFIHEATHHWCFNSHVGNALFLIKLRAFLSSLEMGNITQSAEQISDRKYDIYSDFTRFATVERTLKPLSEGLALFSQFDTYPTQTEVTPSFVIYCTIMFSGIDRREYNKIDFQKFEANYRNFLIERQFISETGIKEKSKLLCTSIDIFENPYLIGYLFVKCLQKSLINQDKRFGDPNFFLEYIKTYYFEDVSFVALLNNDLVKDEEIVPIIFEYFQNHTKDLNNISMEELKIFEKNYQQKEYKDQTLESPVIVALHDQLKKIIDQYGLTDVYFMRSFFCITKLTCYIEISEDTIDVYLRLPVDVESNPQVQSDLSSGEAFKRDGYIDIFTFTFENIAGQSSYKGEAKLEKYVLLKQLTKKFEVFTYGEECLFYPFQTGIWADEEMALIISYFKNSRVKIEDINFDSIISMTWDKDDPVISTIDEFNERNNFSILEQVYHSRSLYCSNNTLANIKTIIKDNGFYDIIHSYKLIELLSFLSLYGSNKNILRVFLQDNEYFSRFTEEELAELEKLLKSAGFQILEIEKNNIIVNCI